MRRFLVLVMVLAAGACESTKSKLDQGAPPPAASTTEATSSSGTSPEGSGSAASTAPAAPAAPDVEIDSKDILARTETAPDVYIKQVLIGWKEVAHDPRAETRTNAQAAALAQDIAAKLKANPDQIDALAKQYSEFPGAKSGEPVHLKTDTPFIPEFKNLAMRLKEKEVGIVKSRFGYDVIERVSKPPPDPMESTAILARQPEAGPVYAQYLVVGWKDAPEPPPGVTRSKADADKLAKDTVDKANAGQDFQKLIASTTDLPGPKDKPQEPLEVDSDAKLPDELKDLPLRLKVGEAGMVKTQFGWLVMKRVAAPPLDPLESSDILARQPVTKHAKVKHILLGWKDVHPPKDPKGEARSRADLEKLVKDTVSKLKKGDKIEPLMAELSEDPGSAKSGESYDVTPDSQFVPSFKRLALRLNVHEVGVVKSEFGIHIMQRVE